jgi:ABC-2 type transport system permease protein
MKKAWFITLKEVRSFLLDKGDLAFSLVLPIAIFALMYGAFGGGTQFNGTAYIVNEDDGGKFSTQLIERMDGYSGLSIQMLSAISAERKLERADIQLAVYIPPDFSKRLEAGQSAQVIFKQRGNGGMEGQIAASLVRGAAESIAEDLMIRDQVTAAVANSGASSQQIELIVQQFQDAEKASPVLTVSETAVGSAPDPVNQFLPGIITMFVLFAVNMTAQALVEERRKGTLERLLTTRLKVGELFMGKFLAYMLRGFIQTLILVLLAYAVFQIFTPLSFLEVMVLAIIFAAAASTIGIIIGSVARSENQATWIAVFFTMLMVMLGGTFFSISEGTILYTLSKLSVNTYANDAFRILISEGGSLADTRMEILVLVGVAVVGLILARLLFRVSQAGK